MQIILHIFLDNLKIVMYNYISVLGNYQKVDFLTMTVPMTRG